MIAFGLAAVLAPAAEWQASYDPFGGLSVSVAGMPLIQGSGWQFYEPGWKAGIHSSAWRPKQVRETPDGWQISFEDDDGRLKGEIVIRRRENGIRQESKFTWTGTREIRLEQCFGRLWAPALVQDRPAPAAAAGLEQRLIGGRAEAFRFDPPLGAVRMRTEGGRAAVFDARGFSADWARGQELVWAGLLDRRVMPGSTIETAVEWSWEPRPARLGGQELMAGNWTATPAAKAPFSTALPLIPEPKARAFAGGWTAFSGEVQAELPEGWEGWTERIEAMIRRLHIPPPGAGEGPLRVRARIASGLPEQGYRLEAGEDGIEISASDNEGLRNGLLTLPWLVEGWEGRLAVRRQTIQDHPSLAWRGVHTLVGPRSPGFQSLLLERVYAPLKLNRSILQIDRTGWDALGEGADGLLPKPELKRLFGLHRAWGVEPAPLIPSFGHAEWLFAGGRNLEAAFNPEIPFTIDPRKPRAQELIAAVWREAFDLLEPKAVHFGLDEVDARGMPNDPELTTRLWEAHLPDLLALAAEAEAEPMLWADMLLAPDEAADAANGVSRFHSARRRAAVPSLAAVVDWHYSADAPPDRLARSLELLRSEGRPVIAAGWKEPANIRAQSLAAIGAGARGYLQTTWAGFDADEAAMVRSLDQMAAYVLAADYAWSGRTLPPDRLPYDPAEVIRRLCFSGPEPAAPIPGRTLIGGRVRRIGPYTLPIGQAATLFHRLTWAGDEGASSVEIPVTGSPEEVVIALSTLGWLPEGAVCAVVEIVRTDGSKSSREVRYGYEVRAARDRRPALLADREGELTAFPIIVEPGESLKTIRLTDPHPGAGVSLRGAVAIP